jgi:hypothetical protein
MVSFIPYLTCVKLQLRFLTLRLLFIFYFFQWVCGQNFGCYNLFSFLGVVSFWLPILAACSDHYLFS